jgi:hypothetical protein
MSCGYTSLRTFSEFSEAIGALGVPGGYIIAYAIGEL